jgi:CRP/FNR family transcriptional activator FtrB
MGERSHGRRSSIGDAELQFRSRILAGMLMTNADKQLVADLPVFKGLSREQLSRLLKFSTLQRYPAGTVLFHEGGQADKLHILISGTVEVYSNGSVREWGVMLMNAGDVFMPGSVLFNEPYTTSARTLGSCRMLLVDGERVRAEAATTAQFAIQLSRAMAGQYRAAIRQVVDLKSRNAAQRLGSFLLKVADNSASPSPELPMRKRSLAARIGMTPETLSRTLQILADNGLVVRGRQIIVRDREKIEQFCGPEPYRPECEDRLEVHVL